MKKLSGTSAIIVAALARSGKTRSGLAEFFGMSPSGMTGRLSRGTFSYEDLEKVAEYTDSELVFRLDPKKPE